MLAIDVGSSSVKAAVLDGTSVVGRIARQGFETSYEGAKAEVNPREILSAVAKAIDSLGGRARRADAIALSVMSPTWVAMDRAGNAITPIVTHQDRRSVEAALELEKRIGKVRHLRLAGNRPFPGGISCA